jgi:hypothetical protein
MAYKNLSVAKRANSRTVSCESRDIWRQQPSLSVCTLFSSLPQRLLQKLERGTLRKHTVLPTQLKIFRPELVQKNLVAEKSIKIYFLLVS